MSIESMVVVLNHSKASGTRKLVLLGIANHQGDGGAWPSVVTLARYANVNERTVQRAVEWLVGKGELRVQVQGGGDRDTADHRRPNRYDVLVECPAYCDRTSQHRDTRKRGTATRQLELSTRVTPVSPGARDGVTPVSPGGVAPVSPEPSIEPDTNAGSSSANGHARENTQPCQVCGKSSLWCQAAQQHWPPADRHAYQPPARATHATG